MKNKGIVILILSLLVIIVLLITIDFSSTRVDNRPDNPYEYEVDEFKEVPAGLIHYTETRQFRMKADELKGISYNDSKIYIIADNSLRIIDENGVQINKFPLDDSARCVKVYETPGILIGFRNYFSIYAQDGERLVQSDKLNDKAVITSIAKKSDKIFLADAGNRKIWVYNSEGKKMDEFEGVSGSSVLHGFIVPSPYFDIAVNQNNELWVVNPGMHALQHYSDNGNLENFWDKSSINIEGFSGCCNPAHFTFLPDGNFITSEKGMVRIKEYNAKGELLSVVAPPGKFRDEGQAPEVAADENGHVIALDFDKKLIRFFKHN